MKKNKTLFVMAGLGVLLAITSCNKEQMQQQPTSENQIVLSDELNPGTVEQMQFIADLRRAVREISVRDLDPANAYNLYDFYGQYFSTMIGWLLDNYDLQSLTFEEYSEIVSNYMLEHPLPGFDSNYALSETDLELVKLSREIAGNPALTDEERIAQLKLMENLITDTQVFSAAAKEMVLISVSITKHLSTIGQSNPSNPNAFVSCFDGEFNSCMHDRMDSLFNTQNVDFNLVDTTFYCLGLPVNVAQDVAACAWSAAWAC
jgi:hypothetical protein